ncbi:DUF3606 domain-containing protein [Pseudolabrys taiwanensis]|uniref:DUF3606 domain-containing protein n=1 Tax=Pseudolabrys taiwanensis TaxID=331696 RepID=A0A345ZZD8_9HYPH|nr:DUF3606 domain-containing protein [Pseudolabrys taiwanensis]AXK82285.1 DUF3606 domain-containing protein [Pseudolabrys taiwanensis]
MDNSKLNRGIHDRGRINVGEDYELRYWSQKFGITPDCLKKIVDRVGDSVSAVEAALRK